LANLSGKTPPFIGRWNGIIMPPLSGSRNPPVCPSSPLLSPQRLSSILPVSQVTRILDQIRQGDSHAAEKLLPLVYDELRKLAAQRLANEKPGQTLQATALVHEAYLRLVAPAPPTPSPAAAGESIQGVNPGTPYLIPHPPAESGPCRVLFPSHLLPV
jgi:ECF sigma factor